MPGTNCYLWRFIFKNLGSKFCSKQKIRENILKNQGYFQALFFYQYTVVNTQSLTEFWNSIFFHNEFFHTTYESNCSKCEFSEICVLNIVWKIIIKVTELLIAIIHYLNQLPHCDLQPADCQTRLCKCYFRRSRDFKVSKGAPTPEHKIF